MAHARAGSKQALWGLAVLREALMAGSFASVLSTFTLAWAGHSEVRSAVAPLNAVSHWRWGRPAFHQREFSVRHTLLGYSIHHCASIWWAAVHAAAMMHHPRSQQPAQVVAGALTTSVVACLVDFKCTPERLKPGFEHHLSRPQLGGVYLAFAAGLALGAMLARSGKTP